MDAMHESGHPSKSEWATLYYRSARRTIRRYGVAPHRMLARMDDRPVFIVGSPRSGTSFTAESIGSMPGFAELGELAPLKRVIPVLAGQPVDVAARKIRAILGRAQRLGQVAGFRAVETTPECTYLIPAILRAYPNASFVHMVRDGRDVAASLIGLGWLAEESAGGADEVGHEFGAHKRFWVEPERADQFAAVPVAVRAAWVWRRYETKAQQNLQGVSGPGGQVIDIRYETLLDDPEGTARRLAAFLGAEDRADTLVKTVLDTVVTSARGRWRRELDATQLAEITSEAGPLLTEFGYTD